MARTCSLLPGPLARCSGLWAPCTTVRAVCRLRYISAESGHRVDLGASNLWSGNSPKKERVCVCVSLSETRVEAVVGEVLRGDVWGESYELTWRESCPLLFLDELYAAGAPSPTARCALGGRAHVSALTRPEPRCPCAHAALLTVCVAARQGALACALPVWQCWSVRGLSNNRGVRWPHGAVLGTLLVASDGPDAQPLACGRWCILTPFCDVPSCCRAV